MDLIYSGDSCICGIDARVYPLEAVTKAAYAFLDRCYVFLFHDDAGILRVRLKSKSLATEDLAVLANEFLNELLAQSVRHQISKETRNLRELIMARALYGLGLETGPDIHEGDGKGSEQHMQYESADAMGPEEDYDHQEIDPLGIATDWFELPDDVEPGTSPQEKSTVL